MDLYKGDGTVIHISGGGDIQLAPRIKKKNPRFIFHGTANSGKNFVSRGFIYKREFNSNSITFNWKFKIVEGTSAAFSIYVVGYSKDSVPNAYSSYTYFGITNSITPSTTETEYTTTFTNSALANASYGYIGLFAVVPKTCTKFEISMTDPDEWEYISPGNYGGFSGIPTVAKVQTDVEYTYPVYNSRWANKSLLCCGDSTTSDRYSYKEYPDYLKTALSMANMQNNGIDGISAVGIASSLSEIRECAGFDLVTMMIGVNDAFFINNGEEQLGSLSAVGSQFDTSTFYGAMQTICEYVLSNNPQGTFVLIQPNFTNQTTRDNTVLTQITPALEAVSQLYRIPFIKTRPCINAINHALYLTDGLHFSDEGEQFFAAYLASAIASI